MFAKIHTSTPVLEEILTYIPIKNASKTTVRCDSAIIPIGNSQRDSLQHQYPHQTSCKYRKSFRLQTKPLS